jgi:PPK2 family polyphosphate:nucleotide phosphotransferase
MYAHRPKGRLDLAKLDSKVDGGLTKDEAQAKIAELGSKLADLQELLFAAGSHSLLVVLQGRDTAGKDGAIRGLSRFVNIQGTRVTSFKVPTAEELAHDYLWRVHPHVPARGQIAIFNRSHYEDVLVVRVHDLVPEPIWRKRFNQIREFEELLHEHNTIIVKCMLHISNEEQEARLLAREEDITKSWKLSAGDWKERKLWKEYSAAYEEAIYETDRDISPWYVLQADRKWFRDLAITELLVNTLQPYEHEWRAALQKIGVKAKLELNEFRSAVPQIPA